MNNLINIENKNGEMVVSSREIANNFEKEHKRVLRAIENLKEDDSDQNWSQCFIPTTYKDDSGKNNKAYLMTRDGFSLLVMGFTGKKALKWKYQYIVAFNKMEKMILNRENNSLEVQNKNAEARLKNAKVKEANFILDTIEKYNLSNISKELLVVNALEVIIGENKLPRPQLQEKTYSATDISKELGVSANMIGKIANQNNLKTEEYGIEVLDKSRYSNKQMPSFRYNEKGRTKLKELLSQN